jgi:hypothetical protein
MSGAVPPLPLYDSWCGQRKFYFSFFKAWLTKSKTKYRHGPLHAIKAYRGRKGTAPFIQNLGSKCEWSSSGHDRFIPRKITPMPTE